MNGVCEPSPVVINAVRLRTRDGRAVRPGAPDTDAVLVATSAAASAWAHVFLLAGPARWPMNSGDTVSLAACDSSWAPSPYLVRVEHGARLKHPPDPHDGTPLAYYVMGGDDTRMWASRPFPPGYPAYRALPLYRGLVKYSHACGCGAGAAGAALGASLHLLGLALLPTLVAAVVCGATGKCLGLWWARRRFDAAARSLATALRARTEG